MWRSIFVVLLAAVNAQAGSSLVERAAELRQSAQALAPEMSALRQFDFASFQEALPKLTAEPGCRSEAAFEPLLSWYLISENMAALENWAPISAFPEIAVGEFTLSLLDIPQAEERYREGLKRDAPDAQRLAKIGLSKVLHKQQKYSEAETLLETAWTKEQLTDEVIFRMAMTKIELGEISEATDLLNEALRWNPLHEMAHYFLGNGYARRNYTELEDTSPYLKCDGTGQCARDYVVDGSHEWMRGEIENALSHFTEALKLVPDYGRAHNGVAKCLEQLRLRENVYRAADARAFDAKATPSVPQIEQYILNWDSLSERHKKQVAISVEPWKTYIPVLVATGSHHYIKPLHEKLSEVPGLETIADQRISYDSRLWDDVRGCGGYTTVTGIEDVERSIYNKYNTVLHELTHQVHGVFPPVDQERIDSLYRAASAIDAGGTEVFVSRYQGSSVWEYFAEGVNSYYSPRRNEYDTREITKERLLALDPPLVAMLEYFMTAPNLEACYPVGFVNAAVNEVELGNLEGALTYARQGEARDPQSESVLACLSQVACYGDHDSLAAAYATRLVERYPDKAGSYGQLAVAQLFTDGDFASAREVMAGGLSKTSGSEQTFLKRELAGMEVSSGKFAEAVVNYRDVLAQQGTDDAALQGYAEALFLSGDIAASDSVYRVALLRRSGLVGLRLDYARLLLWTGRLDDAAAQLAEAVLLKPKDGRLAVHRAWLAQARGDSAEARELTEYALKTNQDDALVQSIAANLLAPEAKRALIERVRTAVPHWVYNETESTFEARSYWEAPRVKVLTEGLNLPSK